MEIKKFTKNDVRTNSYIELSDKAVRLLWELKANSDRYDTVDHMEESLLVTGATNREVNELIQKGYLSLLSPDGTRKVKK